MLAVFVFLAVAAGFVGFVLLSEATMGVGIIAIGCLLGILARLEQASLHHREMAALLRKSGERVPEAESETSRETAGEGLAPV